MIGLHLGQADFHRKPGTVAAAPEQVAIGAHGPGTRPLNQSPVGGSVGHAGGQQDVHGLPDEFAGRIAELLFELMVDQDNLAAVVDEHGATWQRFERCAEQPFDVEAVASPSPWRRATGLIHGA